MNKNFDLLSIDVDGTDYFIWESLSEFLPRLVIIEFNPTVPNDIIFVQAKDANVNHGCSLLALVTLGKQKGYELVCCTSTNAFFVRKEEFHHIGLSNNSHWNLYEPICDGRIFQGYDSTIFVEGMDRLVWKGAGRWKALIFKFCRSRLEFLETTRSVEGGRARVNWLKRFLVNRIEMWTSKINF